jgi:hypothetical protein
MARIVRQPSLPAAADPRRYAVRTVNLRRPIGPRSTIDRARRSGRSAAALTDRRAVEGIRRGLAILAGRREETILAILHGWFVGWVLASAGVESPSRTDYVGPFHLSAETVAAVLDATARYVFARYDLP